MGMYATAILMYGIIEDDLNSELFEYLSDTAELSEADKKEQEEQENNEEEYGDEEIEFEYIRRDVQEKHHVKFETIYAYDEHFSVIIGFQVSASGKAFNMTEIDSDKMNADAILEYHQNIMRVLEELKVENYTQYEPKWYLIANYD